VYPDKKIHFLNVSLCAWICRCVQNPNKFVCTTYIEDIVTWWLRTGNIWNYWQQWQYMKLLTAVAVYEITDSSGSVWNYWQQWQYMKLLTAVAVYEIIDSSGSIWNYWQQWQYIKLLTAVAVYKIIDSSGSIWNYWQQWYCWEDDYTLYLFVASKVSLLYWENLFWQHPTVVGQGSTFLREVGDGLPSDATSYTSKSHTLAFINSKTTEWKL
jgi:hypothetical protein